MEPIVVCHLGVGSIPLDDPVKAGLLDALARDAALAGYDILSPGNDGNALDAVERAVNVLEDSGIVNAGLGAIRQTDGVQRRDASIMDGSTLECGAVSSLEGIKNAVSVARRFLHYSTLDEKLDGGKGCNFYFCGSFVDEIFRIHRDVIPDSWRVAGGRRSVVGNAGTEGSDDGEGENVHGDDLTGGDTVGAVAMDARGNLAAATSTGGTRGSYPGRIGDSPVIGAGTYANRHCAVSNTGRGECILKMVAAKRACDLVALEGMNAMLAVDKMHREHESMFPGKASRIGTIAIDASGNWTACFNGARMAWAVVTPTARFHGQQPGEKKPF